MRELELFNDRWRFHQGDIAVGKSLDKGPMYVQAKTERYRKGPTAIAYSDGPDPYDKTGLFPNEKWEYVHLPHDYVVQGTPTQEENNARGYLKYDNAWYRKHFTLPEEDQGKRLILQFEGVAGNSTVYFNGCLMKHNFCGYTSFDVDITDFAVIGGENVVAVYSNISEHEGWWYEGGGIYRNVWLLKTASIAVDTDGVYVIPQRQSDGRWQVDFEATVVSIAPTSERVEVRSEILDRAGNAVAAAVGQGRVGSHDKSTIRYQTVLENPHLWDVDDPYLYTVRTTVLWGGEACDVSETRTGFRHYICDPERGLILNGRRVQIKGVCAHEDCGLLGKAVPANVHRYKMQMLKEMGANGYRTSHYQQHSAILDACDELGFIVLDEARWFSSTEEGIAQLQTLVKRDRNRPSVFFWSLSNEEYYSSTEQGKRITKTLMEALRRVDRSRPITSAVDKSPDKAPVFDEQDLVGINYNLNLFDPVHEKFPEKAIFSSENCATGTSRGWYAPDCPERGYISAFDKDTNHWFLGREHTWKFLTERPWIMGGYQWAGFEHRGETVWPRLSSQSGAIDLYLQKKDAFYQNQSHWSDKPMVHILPHWNVESYGEPVCVWCYTNCEEVELLLNGRSLGRQRVEKYAHLEWLVDYEPGRIEAVGYVDGEAVATEVHETADAPAQLRLKLENSVESAEDVAIITCYAVDAQGRAVPNATPLVEFHTNTVGKILGTGSDICDHAPLNEPKRQMRAGAVSLAVGVATSRGRRVAEGGEIEVYATAAGLVGAKLTFAFGKESK
ncbi:MAG: DUF4982 domain-containing protein [Clostridia bacterium]|nr:DUF4982 domain-containing protein [Clostridia bacterium]